MTNCIGYQVQRIIDVTTAAVTSRATCGYVPAILWCSLAAADQGLQVIGGVNCRFVLSSLFLPFSSLSFPCHPFLSSPSLRPFSAFLPLLSSFPLYLYPSRGLPNPATWSCERCELPADPGLLVHSELSSVSHVNTWSLSRDRAIAEVFR